MPVASVGSFVESPDGTLFANSGSFSYPTLDPPFFSYQGSGSYRLSVGAVQWEQAGNQLAPVTALVTAVDGVLYVGTNRFLAKAQDGAWTAAGENVEVTDLLVLADGRMLVAGPPPHGAREAGTGEMLLSDTNCAYACGVSSMAETSGNALLVAAYGGFYAGGENLGVYRSTDDGETWSLALPDIGNVRALDASSDMYLLAGTRGPAKQGNPGVGLYRSLDGGETWAPFVDGLTNTEVHAVYSSSGIEYAGTEDGIYVSSGGGTWSADGLPGDTVYAFVDAADGLLAGTSSGLFRRTAPNEWRRFGTGLEDRSVLSLLVTEFDDEELIVAGTDAGVYLSRPGLITVGQEPPAVPVSASRFHAPFPNPANDLVTLRFDLEENGHVRIRAFDTLGRQVAQPVDQSFQAGPHEVPWRVSGLASGTYLLRIEAGDVLSTQRVVVLR